MSTGCSFVATIGPANATPAAPESIAKASEPESPWVIETFPTRPKPGAMSHWATGGAYYGFAANTSDVGTLELRFLDVGQGDTTAIKCPDGSIILVDVGGSEKPTAVAPPPSFKVGEDGSTKADAAKAELAELIGNGKVEALFLSHPDRDHYNGLGTILGDVEVEHVFAAGKRSEYSAKGAAAWLKDRAKPEDFEYVGGTPKITCDNVTIEVKTAKASSSASGSKAHRRNTKSLVLLLSHGEADFVLAADATRATKKDIVEALGDGAETMLNAELLKLAHHGADNTLDEDWFDMVKPTIGIVSAMKGHKYGHPRKTVVDALLPFLATADPHPVSVHDGGSCSKKKGDDGEEYDDCLGARWSTADSNKALFATGDIGTVTVTSDGSVITTKYRKPTQQQETPSAAEAPKQLSDEEKKDLCASICVATAKPCSDRPDKQSNGKYRIKCFVEGREKDYEKCMANAGPDREIWEQCHR